jgi:hypothetical protein
MATQNGGVRGGVAGPLTIRAAVARLVVAIPAGDEQQRAGGQQGGEAPHAVSRDP